MNKFIGSRWFAALILLVTSSLACGGIPSIPGIPTFPPKPGTANVPTGSSPMSGDWNADTEFGHFAFTIDPNGNNVVTAVIKMSNWTCGGTTLTTEVQVLNTWSISGNEFSGNADLGDNGFLSMTFDGTYDQDKKTFSGNWEEDAHGSTCSGNWEAIPRQ